MVDLSYGQDMLELLDVVLAPTDGRCGELHSGMASCQGSSPTRPHVTFGGGVQM